MEPVGNLKVQSNCYSTDTNTVHLEDEIVGNVKSETGKFSMTISTTEIKQQLPCHQNDETEKERQKHLRYIHEDRWH